MDFDDLTDEEKKRLARMAFDAAKRFCTAEVVEPEEPIQFTYLLAEWYEQVERKKRL